MLAYLGQTYKPNHYNNMATKLCLTCGRELEEDKFRYNGRGYSHSCKECCSKKNKNYFVSAGYLYQEESFYVQQLKKHYPDTYKIIIIKVRNGEY